MNEKFVSGFCSSDKMAWGTPQRLFDDLHNVFKFTIDAAACEENAKVGRFWSEENSAFNYHWDFERVWLNPPYGKALKNWSFKIVEESKNAEGIVALVPTSNKTQWYKRLMSAAPLVCLIHHALKFENNGIPGMGAFFSSSLLIFGATTKPQREYLRTIGSLMQKK